MNTEAALGNVMVDCPDAEMLQRFYGELLGWEQCQLYGCPAVRSSGGVVFLFAQEPDYAPPVWPEEPGQQQKQMHFDFQVENVPEAVRRAEALGAVKAKAQFGGEDFTTMLDPAGHPFCLCRSEKIACLPSANAMGRCGFCCGICPTYASGECAGCDTAHRPGDCFTRDCVEKRGVAFCTLCRDFPCDGLLRREKATVLDKAWLQWKQQEQNLAEGAQDEGDNLPL